MKEFFAKVWAVIYNRVIVNWKTTLAGVIGVVTGWLFLDGAISADIVAGIITIFGFLGVVINDPRPKQPK